MTDMIPRGSYELKFSDSSNTVKATYLGPSASDSVAGGGYGWFVAPLTPERQADIKRSSRYTVASLLYFVCLETLVVCRPLSYSRYTADQLILATHDWKKGDPTAETLGIVCDAHELVRRASGPDPEPQTPMAPVPSVPSEPSVGTERFDRNALFVFHQDLCDRAANLMERKNADYANDRNVWGNLGIVEEATGGDVSTEFGIAVRLSDKTSRLLNLLKPDSKRRVTDETIEDSILDLINYGVLLAARRAERKTGG